jgi:CRP/FNR family transcriptional regulator, cyclic AMP receptor protein
MITIDSTTSLGEAGINDFLQTEPLAKRQDLPVSWRSSSPPAALDLPPETDKRSAELSHIPLFSKPSTEKLRQLSTHGVIKVYPKHTILFYEQDPSGSLYIVLGGKVKIYVSDNMGREIVLNICNAGDYFGELELIDAGPCSASAITLEQSYLCIISRTGLQRYFSQYPEMAFELLHSLAQRVRILTADIKSLALDNVYRRVTRILLSLATERDGQWVIEERLTQQDLAQRVGASREMVSRILKDLRSGGYIKTKNGKITIERGFPPAW